jgi:hypothetical protein
MLTPFAARKAGGLDGFCERSHKITFEKGPLFQTYHLFIKEYSISFPFSQEESFDLKRRISFRRQNPLPSVPGRRTTCAGIPFNP